MSAENLNNSARGFVALGIAALCVVVFSLGWGDKSCGVSAPSYIWVYALEGPLVTFVVTTPILIGSFVLGFILQISRRATLSLALCLPILCFFVGYALPASGCSPI